MTAFKLRKPDRPFVEYLRETQLKEYLGDVERLAALLYFSAKRDSDLDLEVRLELTEKMIRKIAKRRGDLGRPVVPFRWDQRHWRGLDPIRIRLAASYGEGTFSPVEETT